MMDEEMNVTTEEAASHSTPRVRPTRRSERQELKAEHRPTRPVRLVDRNLPFVLPESLIERSPHLSFRWVRLTFKHAGEDRENYDNALYEGWVPLTPEEAPEYGGALSSAARHTDLGNIIIRRGHALMVRPKEESEWEQEQHRNLVALKTQAIRETQRHMTQVIVDERAVVSNPTVGYS